MKKIFALLCVTVLFSGCVRYDITLNNGDKRINVSKPKLDKEKNVYTFNEGGQKASVRASHVILIEPHQESQYKSKK